MVKCNAHGLPRPVKAATGRRYAAYILLAMTQRDLNPQTVYPFAGRILPGVGGAKFAALAARRSG
jgi:hypothetical protein